MKINQCICIHWFEMSLKCVSYFFALVLCAPECQMNSLYADLHFAGFLEIGPEHQGRRNSPSVSDASKTLLNSSEVKQRKSWKTDTTENARQFQEELRPSARLPSLDLHYSHTLGAHVPFMSVRLRPLGHKARALMNVRALQSLHVRLHMESLTFVFSWQTSTCYRDYGIRYKI